MDTPPLDRPKMPRRKWLLIAGIVLAVIFLSGLGFVYKKIKSRPLSPVKQTQTLLRETIRSIWLTMNARLIKKINPKDGVKLVFVPAGVFKIGANTSFAHEVYTNPFWAYQTQVTNALFAQCVEEGKCTKSALHVDEHYPDPAYAQHPVVYVTWVDALEYCQAQGGRLPTEAEWEKAASGTSGRFYPWGEISAGPDLTNADNVVGDTTPVGTYADFPSYYGLFDMGGNVREWVSDWYSEPYYGESQGTTLPGRIPAKRKY